MDNTTIGLVLEILKKEVKSYQVPIVDLVKAQTKDPFKVLVATILSARTKDETTATVVRRLFKKVNAPKDLQKLTISEIEELIYPIGFYKNKARFLKKLPHVLDDRYAGIIPQTIDELILLPGVGRKTANLVLVIGFNKPAICVDVHVHRIMNRLGFIKTNNPFDTEMSLRKMLPKRYWLIVNSVLVAFGQNLCTPISPHCSICPVSNYCEKVAVNKSR